MTYISESALCLNKKQSQNWNVTENTHLMKKNWQEATADDNPSSTDKKTSCKINLLIFFCRRNRIDLAVLRLWWNQNKPLFNSNVHQSSIHVLVILLFIPDFYFLVQQNTFACFHLDMFEELNIAQH
jgi:hypothetical protein